MADDTTTSTEGASIQGVAVDDQGMALPADEADSSSQESTTVESESKDEGEAAVTESTEGAEEALPEDDKLRKFAKGQGIEDVSELSEREMSLLKSAYDNKAEYERNRQRASELEKSAKIVEDDLPTDVSNEQRDNARVRNLELKFEVQQWKQNNPDKLQFEAQMVEVLSDPSKRLLLQEGYLSLDDVYGIARGKNLESVKSEGAQEALRNLAQKQQAAVPSGNAVNPTSTGSQITPENVDEMVSRMSVEEYDRRLPEINKALAGI